MGNHGRGGSLTAENAEIAENTQRLTLYSVVWALCVFSAISAFSAVSEPPRP